MSALLSLPSIILPNVWNLNSWPELQKLMSPSSYGITLSMGLESPVQSYLIMDNSLLTETSGTCVELGINKHFSIPTILKLMRKWKQLRKP